VTAGGLVFIAASFDDRLRAFNTDSGKLEWEVDLPAGGQATPDDVDPSVGRQVRS
jgi:quinoprotein glucose dehydrogenase